MAILDPGRPRDLFDASYGQRALWDIAAVQPVLLAVFDEFPPTGPVLDVGCGTGDLSAALAGNGLAAVGVDAAPTAIAQAQAAAMLFTDRALCSTEHRTEPSRCE
jgi:2-polyprenyl-3-methyl-5-hydroxy-6-metoxy-1,4-benzoquinol methylase